MAKRKLNQTDDYNERLRKSNKELPNVISITVSIMHAMGDAEFPLKQNEDRVIDLLKNDIIKMLDVICELKKSKKLKTRISMEDMIHAMQNQTELLSRFLNYLTKKVEMSQFTKLNKTTAQNGTENVFGQEIESDEEEKEENINDIGKVDGDEGDYLEKKRKKMMTDDENLLNEVKTIFQKLNLNIEANENVNSEKYITRQETMLKHIKLMPVESYKTFTEARRISFQKPTNSKAPPSQTSRKKMNPVKSLIAWIGNPPLDGEPAEVFLAFFAKEVIGEIVGSALVEKYNEPEGLFKNDDIGDDDCLQERHYDEAMRKNKNFREFSRIFV